MADLVKLASMDRNPIEETQFQEALKAANMPFTIDGGRTNVTGFGTGGNNAGSAASSFFSPEMSAMRANQSKQDSLMAGQKAQESDFLGRFNSKIAGFEPMDAMYSRISGDMGLPDLRSAATNLTTTLKNLPGAITRTGTAASVNNDRITRAIGERAGALQPVVSDMTGRLNAAEGELGTRMQLGVQDQNRQLQPFQTEASLMSDRMARETSLFSQNEQNELNMILTKMSQGFQATQADLARAHELSMKEKDYQNAKDSATAVIEVGGHKKLINSLTGQVIQDLGSSSAGNGGLVDLSQYLGGGSSDSSYLPSSGGGYQSAWVNQ